MLVQQSIRSLHHKQAPSLIFKIDIAKAFDSVSWQFLFEVLSHRGFGPRWLRRVATLLSTASAQVLVNGSASKSFWHGKGLRKGDPISPLLFIIVMDVLTVVFRKAEEAGVFASLSAYGVHHRLSLYVDDAVLLLRPMDNEMDTASRSWDASEKPRDCDATSQRAPSPRYVVLPRMYKTSLWRLDVQSRPYQSPTSASPYPCEH